MNDLRLLTVPEVAPILRVSAARAYELARDGVLPVVRIGRQVRVDPTVLRDWIREGGAGLVDESQSDDPEPDSPSGSIQ